jgi:hypothetical protein
MLAMAVSSEAIANAVKIAATAHRRRSQGKPSGKPPLTAAEGVFAAVLSLLMLSGSPGRQLGAAQAAFTTEVVVPPDASLHDAYALGCQFGPTFGYFPPGG